MSPEKFIPTKDSSRHGILIRTFTLKTFSQMFLVALLLTVLFTTGGSGREYRTRLDSLRFARLHLIDQRRLNANRGSVHSGIFDSAAASLRGRSSVRFHG